MLIKSHPVTVAEKDKASVSEEDDKLQERLKQEQDPHKSTNLKLFPTKNCNFLNERKLSKPSSPLDITEIRQYLLLCGAVALRGNVLEDLKVTCIINATTELPDTPLPNSLKDNNLYLRVKVNDKPDSDILSWLDLIADIIHQVKLAGGKTLIHCVAGISRSATLCLAYLIKYEGYSLLDSYLMLKTLRDIIRPNSGFFSQLIEFEKRTTGKQTVLMIYSDYARSCIPHLYEEDYQRLHMLRSQRTNEV